MLLASLSGAIMMSVAPPPKRYDHQPVKPMAVVHMTPAKVRRWCKHHSHGACAILVEKGCLVVLPDPKYITPAAYDRLYAHERAHCNGWKHG